MIFSIIITTYNYEKYIIESIDNIVVWRAIVDSLNKFDYTFISNNIEKIIGCKASDLTTGKISLFNIIHHEHKKYFKEWLKKKSNNINVNHKIICSDETEKWVATKLFIKDCNGEKIVTGTHTDITDQVEKLIFSLRKNGVNENTIANVLSDINIV